LDAVSLLTARGRIAAAGDFRDHAVDAERIGCVLLELDRAFTSLL
jgi:hypothetical protein